MDIRQHDPDYPTKQEQQNITDVAVYNLIKRKSIYNQLIGEFAKSASIQMGAKSTFVTMYSYKPAVYLTLAALYHLKARRLGATWFFIHAGVLVLLNQYDTNKGAQQVNPQKWDQYQEATKNYQTALSMINVSVWEHVKSLLINKITSQDYLKVLKLRPH